MLTDLQTRIAAIKAQCKKIIRLNENATPGPWSADEDCVMSTHGIVGYSVNSDDEAEFIAHSRNVSPAMARVVVQLIEYVEAETECADESCMCYDHKPAIAMLERIANQWEGKP